MRRNVDRCVLSDDRSPVLPVGPPSSYDAAMDHPPRILLRSSWQIVNIGDIAHTPGVLALIERHLPGAEVVLWASDDLSAAVAAMEHRRFPGLRIVKGRIGDDGSPANPALGEALAWCDLLLHGSGPSLVAQRDVAAFVRHVGKPFGVFGITYGGGDEALRALMSQARFLFFRDSASLALARSEGIAAPVMAFGPDGAFACDLRDEAGAEAVMRAHGLEEGRFLCCIPRLRFTPYWLIHGFGPDVRKHERNQAMADHDHAQLRAAIIEVVRRTGLKILVCPEDRSQMAVGREWIIDRLPPDVLPQVAWLPDFWLTDTALSVYRRSAGLFGNEMHSPIMCIGNGIPAIVCRFEEQTSKGLMWRDLGLGGWLFDLDDEAQLTGIVPAVLAMALDPAAARATAQAARLRVETLQRGMVAEVAKAVG